MPLVSILNLTFVLVLLVGCGSAQPNISSSHSPGEKSGSNSGIVAQLLSWQSQVRISLDSELPGHVVAAISVGIEVWNNAVGFDLITMAGWAENPRGESLYSSLDDDETVVYFEKNWINTTDKSDATLATTVWEVDSENPSMIVKGDIILNAEVYSFVDALDHEFEDDPNLRYVDSETVIIHELGHLLGLGHTDSSVDERSVMLPKTAIGLGVAKRNLSSNDGSAIKEIYIKE